LLTFILSHAADHIQSHARKSSKAERGESRHIQLTVTKPGANYIATAASGLAIAEPSESQGTLSQTQKM